MVNQWNPDKTVGLLGKWEENVAMSAYASYRAGGIAKYVYCPFNLQDLSRCLSQIPLTIPVIFLGKSTNLLVSDLGFDGVIILLAEMCRQNRTECFFEVKDTLLHVSAAISCPKVAQIAVSSDLVGLEFFAGIPGSIGGALTMNAGSAGASTWDHIEKVHMINRSGECFEKTPDDFDIGYRKVAAKFSEPAWFVGAEFRLSRGDIAAAKAKIEEILSWRKSHQPLALPSAGSVFKNPEGDTAGRLIDSCGLKGFHVGDAEVSERHANFIVNKGNATATDIVNLIRHVRAVVYEKTGIHLEPEVKLVGESI